MRLRFSGALSPMLLGIVFVGCSDVTVVRGAPFSFDATRPYRVAIGWGGGLSGIDTLEVFSDGKANGERGFAGHPQAQAASTTLSPRQVATVTALIVRFGLEDLACHYDAHVCDGTQWILDLEQDGRHRTVYCDNHFPKQLIDFRSALQVAVAADTWPWLEAPSQRPLPLEQRLWDVVRQLPLGR
ncbi:MAG: hypothetical protein R3F29_14640 [Planctomycetota bacterium]